MDSGEKSQVLLERAEKLALRLKFDCGLIVCKRTESGDPERQDAIIEELNKYLTEVRRLVERRAIAASAKELLGQRIWSEDGEGVLAGASGDGLLTITIVKEGFRHPQTLAARPEGLVVIHGEEADGASSSHDDEPKPEKQRRGIFELLRSSAAGSSVERDRS
jgi:hypothetical protein